jgi:hypothetical protein
VFILRFVHSNRRADPETVFSLPFSVSFPPFVPPNPL